MGGETDANGIIHPVTKQTKKHINNNHPGAGEGGQYPELLQHYLKCPVFNNNT